MLQTLLIYYFRVPVAVDLAWHWLESRHRSSSAPAVVVDRQPHVNLVGNVKLAVAAIDRVSSQPPPTVAL